MRSPSPGRELAARGRDGKAHARREAVPRPPPGWKRPGRARSHIRTREIVASTIWAVTARGRRAPRVGGGAGERPPSCAGGSVLAASSRRESLGCRSLSSAASRSACGSCARRSSARSSSTASSWCCAERLVRTRLAWSALARRLARALVPATTARSSSARTVSEAPMRASTDSMASQLFAYAMACVERSATASSAPSAPATSRKNVAEPRDAVRSSR